ncbi:MAG: DNA repair protein [Nitrosomonadales bacterium SCN 54-20]|nr:MAG: DNA repair protein [Nitrosomonadales bacterium SCN 54-20]
MSRRKKKILPLLAQGTIVALLAGSWPSAPSASAAGGATDRNVKKERQMLRRMQQQLNEVQQQKSALDEEKTALEETLKNAGKETESHKKSAASAAARASRLEKDIEAAGREKAELSAQLKEAQKQNQELDLQRKQLEQDLKVKSASLAKEGEQRNLCETNNGELYRIGRELVDWYASKGPLNAILEAEPFTGMKSVEMENLLENYREKLETRHLEPSISRESREIHGHLLP